MPTHPPEQQLLAQIAAASAHILGENLVGVYVHGSLALGCFHWDRSDIDFLLVAKEPPTPETKEKLLLALLELDALAPPKGLEMSLALQKHCRPFCYPTPFELHFSNAHKERCRADVAQYCQTMHGVDWDLAAHFTVLGKVGIPLYGPEIPSVFGHVPRACYLDSIRRDVENALHDIAQSPVSVILNLCRVLAANLEDLVLSKEQGALWAMERLPLPHRKLARAALRSYRTGAPFPKGGHPIAPQKFAEFILGQL